MRKARTRFSVAVKLSVVLFLQIKLRNMARAAVEMHSYGVKRLSRLISEAWLRIFVSSLNAIPGVLPKTRATRRLGGLTSLLLLAIRHLLVYLWNVTWKERARGRI